jgi:hypothetical protein
MLAPMNFRRGLQRLYIVLALVWAVWAFDAVISGRWIQRLWLDIHLGLLPPGTTVITSSSGGSWDVARLTPDLHYFSNWAWAIGLSILPPLLLYLLCFYVGPWVYRGFSPKPQ